MAEEIKIYVSCPINTPINLRLQAYQLVDEAKGIPYYWEVGSFYNETIMDEATAVVVILPDKNENKSSCKWGSDFSCMPQGTKSEILRALNRQLPVFILYESGEGFFIYRIESNSHGIKGRGGTKLNLAYVISEEKKVREGKKKEADHAVLFGNGHATMRSTVEEGWTHSKSGRVSCGGPNMQSIPVLPSKFEVWLAGQYPTLSIEDRNKLILII